MMLLLVGSIVLFSFGHWMGGLVCLLLLFIGLFGDA